MNKIKIYFLLFILVLVVATKSFLDKKSEVTEDVDSVDKTITRPINISKTSQKSESKVIELKETNKKVKIEKAKIVLTNKIGTSDNEIGMTTEGGGIGPGIVIPMNKKDAFLTMDMMNDQIKVSLNGKTNSIIKTKNIYMKGMGIDLDDNIYLLGGSGSFDLSVYNSDGKKVKDIKLDYNPELQDIRDVQIRESGDIVISGNEEVLVITKDGEKYRSSGHPLNNSDYFIDPVVIDNEEGERMVSVIIRDEKSNFVEEFKIDGPYSGISKTQINEDDTFYIVMESDPRKVNEPYYQVVKMDRSGKIICSKEISMPVESLEIGRPITIKDDVVYLTEATKTIQTKKIELCR